MIALAPRRPHVRFRSALRERWDDGPSPSAAPPHVRRWREAGELRVAGARLRTSPARPPHLRIEVAPVRADAAADAAGEDAVRPRRMVSSGMDVPAADAEEAAIVARVQLGDREAFGILVRRYSARAYAVAYRVMRHSEDAQDLVQDAFVAALDGIASFDTSRPFGPWLMRIVTYRGINARKSRTVRERHVRVAPVEDRDAAVAGPDAERAEIREKFAAALGALPDRQRTVVQLADVDGHTSQEIGRMLGISDGTVRWHLHTARATLRAALAPFRRKTDD